MPRYRDRRVPNRISTASPLDGPVLRVDWTDGYQPAVSDTDIMQFVQGAKTSMWLNEVAYIRAQHVPGHNSDALVRLVETVGATGKGFEIQDEPRTTEVWSVDTHTGHTERFREVMTDLQVIGPTDTRPANTPEGVALIAGSQFSMVPPEIYGARMMTIDPNLCTLNRAFTSQDLWAAKVFCNADMTLTTMSTRVQTATLVVGVSGYNGYAIYDDGTTMNLLGSTTDDATLFQTTGQKAKNLTTPVDLQAGNFYWFCMISNWTGTTLEVATTVSMGAAPGVTNSWPAGNTTARLATQTSFPATITRASMSGNAVRPCIAGY